MTLGAAIARAYHGLIAYALKFGVVGLGGYVLDVGVFNILRFSGIAEGTWASSPVGAKVVSVTLATVATWFGNRYWTFRDRRRANYWLELAEFCLVALVGMGISVGCLYVSHYVLGYQSPLADNISANVIGLFLATAFRFLMYRFWVFGSHRTDGLIARNRAERRESAEV
jgi:putative flippase GtrA